MARRTHGFSRPRPPARTTLWIGLALQEVAIAAASTAILFASLNAAALALRPFTIIRTRLDWHCRSNQSAAAELWGGAFAGAVVSDQASVVGVTAVPTPVAEIDSDFFFFFAQNFD